jgi:hypothetical protein
VVDGAAAGAEAFALATTSGAAADGAAVVACETVDAGATAATPPPIGRYFTIKGLAAATPATPSAPAQ